MTTSTALGVIAPRPTDETYGDFQGAYDHFNASLFGGKLPNAMITLVRSNRFRGYFLTEGFQAAGENGHKADEIAMNPEAFKGRTDKAILSTLVHEMCHLQQYHTGTPSPGGYHNKEWGVYMKAVGLHPSNTGAAGGAETGVQMTHYIVDGGRFDVACDTLLAQGWAIRWRTPLERLQMAGGAGLSNVVPPKLAAPTGPRAAAKRASKTKYVCPECAANAWAKPHAHLYCGAGHAPAFMREETI